MLEGTYEETTIPAGPEVEAFARLLDESSMFRGAGTADAKARILKLVDNYHRYVSEKCRQLRSRTSPRRGQKSWQRSARDDASNQDSNNDMDLDDLEDEALTPRETEEVRRWEAEMQTWDLLRRILPLRYTEQGKAKPVGRSETAPTTNAYWDEFLLSDTLALERKHVLSWLQSNAETGPDIGDLVRELQQRADRGDIVSHGWLHTRSAIKLHKNVTGWPHVLEQDAEIASGSQAKANPTPLITQLDPDAKTRQNRRLDVKDEYFEKAIWVGCFELLRRGRSMAEIRDWCSERTEIWRAVCMSALPLSKDDSEAVAPYDPAAVILWRRICYALARQGGTDDFERAVYGILSGDVLSVDKVCKTWDDLMFANYNALLRTQFDTYLIGRARPEASAFSIQTFPAFNAVQFHGDAGSVAERLVRAVEADVRVKGTLTPLKVLQGALIANSFDQFAYNLGIVLAKQITDPAESKLIPDFGLSADGIERSKCMDINDYDGLRIVIHVLIAIQSLEGGASSAQGGAAATRRQVQENIISAYITFLRLAGLYELIPLYASRLVGPRAYYTLSKNLIHLEDQESRKTQLSLIQRMGLDVRKFVAFQPNVYLSDLPESDTLPGKAAFKILTKTSPTSRFGHKIIPDFFGEDPDSVERADEDLIRSLEWLLLVPDSWSEAFHFATEAYKYFLSKQTPLGTMAVTWMSLLTPFLRDGTPQCCKIPGLKGSVRRDCQSMCRDSRSRP